jgi:hypothetical protein
LKVKWFKSHWKQENQTGQTKSAKITYTWGRRTLVLTIMSWFMNCNIPVTRHTCTCTTYSGGYIFVLSLRSPLLCCR